MEPSAQAADFLALTKPRLSGLVLFTAAGGMALAPPVVGPGVWAGTLLGTACIVGAANALNCIMERDLDALMARTANRPLPAGRLSVAQAARFATLLIVVAVPSLALLANPLAAALGVAALGCYVLAYTPLKKRTHWAMEVGAVAGAIPPLIGWAAATGRVGAGGLVLAGILFVWQLPHFIAIALFRRFEYATAGLASLPLAKGDEVARRYAVAWTLVLVASTAGPVAIGMSGAVYAVAATVFGAGFLRRAVVGQQEPGWARRLFGGSLTYLTGLFVALGVDRWLC